MSYYFIILLCCVLSRVTVVCAMSLSVSVDFAICLFVLKTGYQFFLSRSRFNPPDFPPPLLLLRRLLFTCMCTSPPQTAEAPIISERPSRAGQARRGGGADIALLVAQGVHLSFGTNASGGRGGGRVDSL